MSDRNEPFASTSGSAANPSTVQDRPARFGVPRHPDSPPPVDQSLPEEVMELFRKEAEAEKHARENPPDPEVVRKHRERMNLRRIVWERAGGFGGRPPKFSPRVQNMLSLVDRGQPIPEDF